MGFYYNDCTSNTLRRKDTWVHVAFVYNKADKTQTIVVDGNGVTTCSNKAPFVGTDTVYLGRWKAESATTWQGKISNVNIFNTALTIAQINAIQCNK